MVFLIYLLVCIFAMGFWVVINGFWVELFLLVMELFEGWFLFFYLTLVIQLVNIGFFLVILFYRFRFGCFFDVFVIFILLGVGIVICFFFVFFWNVIFLLQGKSYSIIFFVFILFLVLVDCIFFVIFLFFMSRLFIRYVIIFFVGEGFSGFLFVLLVFVQGSGFIICFNVIDLFGIISYFVIIRGINIIQVFGFF